jgi:hypothetical protein
MGVVVEQATGHKAAQVGAHYLQLQATYKARQMIGVGADIAERTTRTGTRGINAPCRLLVATGF